MALGAFMTGGTLAEVAASLSVAISVEEAVAAGVAIGIAGGGIVYSRNSDNDFPMDGKPNTTFASNGSIGEYDEMGHLRARKDFTQSHYVKSVGKDCNPHTHVYKWWKHNGIWYWKEITVLPH